MFCSLHQPVLGYQPGGGGSGSGGWSSPGDQPVRSSDGAHRAAYPHEPDADVVLHGFHRVDPGDHSAGPTPSHVGVRARHAHGRGGRHHRRRHQPLLVSRAHTRPSHLNFMITLLLPLLATRARHWLPPPPKKRTFHRIPRPARTSSRRLSPVTTSGDPWWWSGS